jgi:predicted house-cleaning noncanonical NTP pyrophosphatase (MazG superfamily)
VGKLVPDRIPEIMTAKGLSPEVRLLDAAEYHHALRNKLAEEALEAQAAEDDHLASVPSSRRASRSPGELSSRVCR